MVDFESIKKLLEEKTGLAYFNASNTELISICPFCEMGSRKNHGHLYIKIPRDEREIPVFNCFKCGEDGGRGTILKLLRYLKSQPKEFISEEVLNFNRTRKNYVTKKTNIDNQLHSVNIDDSLYNKYPNKVQYLKSRLGFGTKIERIPNLVFGVEEFINNNNFKLQEKDYRIIKYLEESFVGFLTNRGTKLVLRNIDSTSSFRYYNMQLTENSVFKDFYGVKLKNNSKNLNTIVLCEGIFDLLVSLRDPCLNEIKNKSIFWAASLGSFFTNLIPSVLDFCKIPISNVIVLSDSDKNMDNYKWLKYNPSVNNCIVYKNKYGSDFGSSPIELVRI